MSKPALFCLRAAASRAARRANRFSRNHYCRGFAYSAASYAAIEAMMRRYCFRAEVTKYAYFDAAYEAQREGLTKLAA